MARMAGRRTLTLLAIGTAAGLFSGLFGVGGGVLIVPLLVLWCGFGERLATGTSLAAIVIIAAVATAAHGAYGNVHLREGLLVGVPAVAGVLLGTELQQRISARAISLVFAGLLDRRRASELFAGLCDRGGRSSAWRRASSPGCSGSAGGALFVPALTLGLGLSQLDAEATSLLAIIPVALVGAARQRAHGNVDVRTGVVLGLVAVGGALAGVVIANAVPERALEIGFGLFLLFVAWRLVVRALSAGPAQGT